MRSLSLSRNVLAALVLALVGACLPPSSVRPAPAGLPELVVTGTATYMSVDDVPRPLADLAAGEFGTVYFAVSNGQYCKVSDAVFSTVIVVGRPFACRWRSPRGA